MMVWPVSVTAETAPSTMAVVAAEPELPLPMPSSAVVEPALPPTQPPPPFTWMRSFQLSGLGSHTSMPMPGDVEGASAGPGLPGPTLSLTTHTSDAAVRVLAVGAPDSSKGSPALN